MTFIRVVALLRKVPFAAWVTLGLVAAAGGLTYAVAQRTQYAYALGYSAALEELELLSRNSPVQNERARVAAARVDTVVRVVDRSRFRVDALLVRVDSLRTAVFVDAQPAANAALAATTDSALTACAALSRSCGEFRALVALERAARDSVDATRNATLALSRDSTQRLRTRVTRKRALAYTALAALLGYAAGRVP